MSHGGTRAFWVSSKRSPVCMYKKGPIINLMHFCIVWVRKVKRRKRLWRVWRRESWSWTKQATVNWLPRKSFASSLNLSLNPSSSIFLLNCAFHILLLLFFLICNQFQYPLLLSYFWFRFHPLGLLQLCSSFCWIVNREIGEPRRRERKQNDAFFVFVL